MSLRFTKEKFKTAMHLFGACSFAVAFGIGHGLASQDHIDKSPVITVPLYHDANGLLNPVSFDIGNSSSVNYEVSYAYSASINIDYEFKFFVDSNVLYCSPRVVIESLGRDYISNSISLGLLNLNTDDVTIEVNFSVDNTQTLNFYNEIIINGYYGDTIEPEMQVDELTTDIGLTNVTDERINIANLKMFLQLLADGTASYQDGYNDAVNYVLSHLSQYNLYTSEQYYAYGVEQYNLGRNASANVMSVSDMIREIFRAPISMFQNAFNFVLPLPDGTSLNVGGILTFFLTIGIALTIVSLISKIGGR